MAGRVVLRKKAIDALARSDEMAAIMLNRSNDVVVRGRAAAPMSPKGSHGRKPGYLRANIRTKWARDTVSVYADVSPEARTPPASAGSRGFGKRGFRYGRFWEMKLHFLRDVIK